MMEAVTHFVHPDDGIYSAITPEACTDSGSTDLDEGLFNGVSPVLSEDLYNSRNCQIKPSVSASDCVPGSTILPSLLDKSSDGQWNLIKVPVGFDVTRKGERSLVIGGYKFTKSRDGMGGRVFWRCSRRECKATAVTVANRVQHVRAIHSHQPPVAAEFFADDSSRCEQEVRFSSTTSGHQSRIRRRSQPNLPKSSSPTDSDLPREDHVSTDSFLINTQPQDIYSPSAQLKSESPLRNRFGDEQFSSPEKKRHRSENIFSEGLTAHALSTLLAKLVDSRQAKSANSTETKPLLPNGLNDVNGFCTVQTTEIASKLSASTKTLTAHEVKQIQSVNPKPDTAQNHTSLSGLEQLATLATSLASTPAKSLHFEAGENVDVNPTTLEERNCLGVSQLQINSTYSLHSVAPKATSTTITSATGTTMSSSLVQALSNPSTVGLVARNSQGQVVLLIRDQLTGLIRPARHETSGPNEHLSNSEILTTARTTNDSIPTSLPTKANKFFNGHYSEFFSTNHSTNSNSSSSINESSVLDHSDIHMQTTVPQLANSYNLPDYQHPNNQPPNSLNDSRSKNEFTFLNSEIRISNQDNLIPNGNSLTVKAPNTPNLLVHWKKEKIRESAEEIGGTHAFDFPDGSDLDEPYKMKSGQDIRECLPSSWETQSSIGLGIENDRSETSDGYDSKMRCCCADSLPDYPHLHNSPTTTTGTSPKISRNETYDRLDYLTNNKKISSDPREEDNIICTQIQDVVLIKVLSTVQQLTAKLDGDADPPEVIQNCQAIQACLDTIAAIKRARSAGNLVMTKSQSDSLQPQYIHDHHPFPLGNSTTTVTNTHTSNMTPCPQTFDNTLQKFNTTRISHLNLGQSSILQPLQQYH